MIEVERAGERLALEITPRQVDRPDGEGRYWALGIAPPRNQPLPPKDAMQRHGPVEALPVAVREVGHLTGQLVGMIGRAFSGRVAIENTVAGPITIARAANTYAQQGAAWYLTILALLSLSLAILNLRPSPCWMGDTCCITLSSWSKAAP